MAEASAGDRAGTPRLHGRSSVLAQIAAALDEAEAGHGRLLLVAGSPGIGKSSILAAAVQRGGARGFRVLEGRVGARDTPVPYDLLRALLESQRGPSPGPGAVAEDQGLPGWLVAEDRTGPVSGFPSIAVLPDNETPVEKRMLGLFDLQRSLVEIGRKLLFAQLERVLLGDPKSAPVLLSVDDLHHADRDSLDFLHSLASEVPNRRVFLIASFDPDLTGGGFRAEKISALARVPAADSVGLSPLSLEDTAEMVRDLRAAPASTDYARAIYQRSRGVPSTIELLTRRYGDTVPPGGPGPGPTEASGDLAFHPASLPEETLRILTYGAVIGRQFELPLLGRTLHRRQSDSLEPVLAPLVASGILRRTSGKRYEFVSAATRQMLYSALTEARRRLLHRNVARALEVDARPMGPELYETAWHYYLAGEVAPAIEFNRRAADLACREYAYVDARLYLERALELLRQLPTPRPESVRVIRTALGHVLGRIGKFEEAIQVLDALRDPADTATVGPASLRYLWSPEVRPDLWAHAENARTAAERSLRAFRTTGELRWLAVAHRALGVASWSLADPAGAEAHHWAAAGLARQTGDVQLEGQSLLDRAHLVRMLDANGAAIARNLLTEAIERFTASGGAEWLARAYMDRSTVLRSLGRLADALSDLTAASEQAARSGSATLQIWVEARTARVLVEEGRTGRARKSLERLGQLAGASPRREVEQQVAFISGMLQEREGRLDKARGLYEKSLSIASEAGALEEVAETHMRLAAVEERLGRTDEAERHLTEARRLSGVEGWSMPDSRTG